MKSKFVTALVSLLTLGCYYPALAETELSKMIEIDRLCVRFPHNSICKDKESYISLEKWEKNKTVCSLATEWNDQEKKCKVVVGDRELIIYVEQGIVSESLPNTLKTEVIKISLDDIFAFDTQWWLANVRVTSMKMEFGSSENNYSSNTPETSLRDYSNSVGIFSDLQIGFISNDNASEHPTSRFLTISAKQLHQILEKMEYWRYYLPDLTAFEEQFKPKTSNSNYNLDISKNIAKLKETNECSYCDLRNANLTEMNLERANLAGANLAGANLEGANLEGAYLLGANLNKSNLNNANLETANLMFASLTEANLIQVNLRGGNLQNTNFKNADLTESKLKAKKFKVTNLKNANFKNANLTNANLNCINLQFANLKNANLTNADLKSCEFAALSSSFQLSRLTLNNRGVPYTFFHDIINTVGVVNTLVQAIKNPSIGTVLNLTLPTVIYSLNSNLSGANLTGANLTGANLTGANLTDTNLSNTILEKTKLSTNQLNNANFISADIRGVKFEKPVSICQAIFSDESIYEEHCQEEEEVEEKEKK